MNESTTDNIPAESGQIHYVGVQQILCVLALALCGAYAWSRGLHWIDFKIATKGTLSPGLRDVAKTEPMDGKTWSGLNHPMWLFGFASLFANGIYLFFHRFTDQLVPAIANTAIGGMLTVLTLYFISGPDRLLHIAAESKTLSFSIHITSGVYVALLFAVALLAVGITQIVLRGRAQAAADEPDAESAD